MKKIKKACIYNRPGNAGDVPCTSMAEGLESAGYKVVWRNPAPFGPDQVEDFDLVVVWSELGVRQLILAEYASRDVPCLVLENGYFGDTWALGIYSHYWLPMFSDLAPTDRAKAMSLEALERELGEGHEDAPVVFCGQGPKADAALAKMAEDMRELTDRAFIFRPHPLQIKTTVKGFDGVMDPHSCTVEEMLECVHSVVTFTSNVGNEAILAGVPVITHPAAMYADIALMVEDLEDMESIQAPDVATRQEYLNRLAYGQWTAEDLEDGTALGFVFGQLTGEAEPQKRNEPLVGSDRLPAILVIDGTEFQLGDIVCSAHEASGLTVDEWNAQPEDELDALLLAEAVSKCRTKADLVALAKDLDISVDKDARKAVIADAIRKG